MKTLPSLKFTNATFIMKYNYHLLPFIIFIFLSTSLGARQQPWWKKTIFYQVYMPSYSDSNGDGYSDFKGMTAKLGYLKSLGIKGIWLTPFLKSPKVDNGYDVADYYAVDPVYGNIRDFKNFLTAAHENGIKVIIDMVLNHSSTDSHWFTEARKSVDNPYRNYYIWRDKPNNWESFFGGSAWQKDSMTNQYYYHKFDVRMADLNWTNPALVGEVKKVLRYWLDLGVDGFRFDVINFLSTDPALKDNPVKNGQQEHVNDIDQAGVKEAIKTIRSVINEYKDRFVVGEIGSDKINVLKQYQSPGLLDVVFNFNFGSIPSFSAERIFQELKNMDEQMPGYPTLFFGSHDMPRLMDRLANGDTARAKALAVCMLTFRGVPFIYYGEELGMKNIIAAKQEDIKDVQGKNFYKLSLDSGRTVAQALVAGNAHNRDKSRSPMQWNDQRNAGFTTGIPWINVNDDYKTINAAAETTDKKSLLNFYKQLIALRNATPALQYGTVEDLELNNGLLNFTRSYNGQKIKIYINFGTHAEISSLPAPKVLFGTLNLERNGFLIYR